jgi:hypothetical protein
MLRRFPAADTISGHWLRTLVKMVHHNQQHGVGYIWHEMMFFSRWEPGHFTMLCVDTPDYLRPRMEQVLGDSRVAVDLKDPFALLMPMVDQICLLYDQSVWSIRTVIREAEKVCTTLPNELQGWQD